MEAAASSSRFEASRAAALARTELVKVAAAVIGHGRVNEAKRKGRPRVPRQEIIRRSKILLEKREGKPVVVGDLAAAAGVSERTLQAAFNEYFGIGPVRYLQVRQLHQIHRALKSTDPRAKSVTNVLTDHGVWELGRFASRYRRLFGELPSQSMKSKAS